MNDFRSAHTFKSVAFQPTEEEFIAATKRKRPTTFRQPSILVPPKRSQAKAKAITAVLSDLSDSDDDLPDIKDILKDVAEGKNSQEKPSKPKKIVEDDEDDDDDDSVCLVLRIIAISRLHWFIRQCWILPLRNTRRRVCQMVLHNLPRQCWPCGRKATMIWSPAPRCSLLLNT